MRGDLHVHSTASDGTLTPSQLVSAAKAARLDVLAIADHDTVSGQAEARAAAEGAPLILIPAVELSCLVGDSDVHVLGYFIDVFDRELLERLDELKRARVRRAERLVQQLTESGLTVSLDEVLAHAAGGSVGRSHIARALVTAGHAPNVHEAFDRYIGRGRPFYVAKEAQTSSEAVSLIHSAGGVAVVAHPGIGDVRLHLEELVSAGIDGLEAFHADHDASQRAFFSNYAREHGLITTGGTDFHGTSSPNPPLGEIELPEHVLPALLSLAADG